MLEGLGAKVKLLKDVRPTSPSFWHPIPVPQYVLLDIHWHWERSPGIGRPAESNGMFRQ
jgi:hypothetical protein